MIHVLDTNIIILFLKNRLADPPPDNEIVVSVITEIELLSFPGLPIWDEQLIRNFLADVDIAGVSADIRDAAVRLRREHRLRLPDAIIAGTALALDGELLTNDTRLARTPGLRSRVLALRAP